MGTRLYVGNLPMDGRALTVNEARERAPRRNDY